jgi:hypothetical protein
MYSIVLVAIDIFLLIKFKKPIKGWMKRRLKRNRYVKSLMLRANYQLDVNHTEIDNDMSFSYMNCGYFVNPALMIWEKGNPVCFHVEGNPNPVDFRTLFSKAAYPEVNSENYQLFKTQKLIKDYASDEKLIKIVIAILIIVIVMLLVIAGQVFGLFDKVFKGIGK